MKTISLYTHWRLGKLECCCPPENRCLKDKGCELIKFSYNEYEDVRECMKHDSYKRVKGALRQK